MISDQMLLTCRQERESSSHWRKLRQQCGCVHVFGTFFSLTRLESTWPSLWATVRRREIILNCRPEMAVERVVCLVFAFWLANRCLSPKSRRHLNLQLSYQNGYTANAFFCIIAVIERHTHSMQCFPILTDTRHALLSCITLVLMLKCKKVSYLA